jgi:hypothetical protein
MDYANHRDFLPAEQKTKTKQEQTGRWSAKTTTPGEEETSTSEEEAGTADENAEGRYDA